MAEGFQNRRKHRERRQRRDNTPQELCPGAVHRLLHSGVQGKALRPNQQVPQGGAFGES